MIACILALLLLSPAVLWGLSLNTYFSPTELDEMGVDLEYYRL